MKVAIVGSGVSGLVCAYLLHGRHDVTLFEADARPGGHAHSHELHLPDADLTVDTGFLVYNERTYPLFCRLLEQLGISTQASDMSFSVSDALTGTEWRGTSPATVFAQPSNLARPQFWRMIVDIARFNRLARRLVHEPCPDDVSLEDFLAGHRWSRSFRDGYLVPIGSSIWSAAPSRFTQIPAATFARFFERHGLLQLHGQPAWRTLRNGAQSYVQAILRPLQAEGRLRLATPVDKIRRHSDRAELVTAQGPEDFDEVIVATHSDQALGLLSDADRAERDVLGAIAYQANRATLHTDVRLMPRARRAWASWNYRRLAPEAERATLTYHLNQLQGLATSSPVLVTLNQDDSIDPGLVLARMDYQHPVLDLTTVKAQQRRHEISGRRHTWFCGAYWGYGFHEDGVRSAVDICRELGVHF